MWADLARSDWDDADELAVQAIEGAFGSTIGWWLSRAPELQPREIEARLPVLVEPALNPPVPG